MSNIYSFESVVVTSESANPLQTKSTGSMLLTCHKPHCKKPIPKWFVRSMKQRSRSNGSLPSTFSAEIETTICQRWFLLSVPTVGTTEVSRPSKLSDIINAGIVAAQPFIKLLECSRIINAGNRGS